MLMQPQQQYTCQAADSLFYMPRDTTQQRPACSHAHCVHMAAQTP
jgi:hypothetical protein